MAGFPNWVKGHRIQSEMKVLISLGMISKKTYMDNICFSTMINTSKACFHLIISWIKNYGTILVLLFRKTKKKAPLSTATYTLYCVYVVHHQPQINPVSASTISLSDLVCAGQKLTLICASKKEKKP